LKYPGTYSENFDKSFYDLFMISTAKLLACKVASLLAFLLANIEDKEHCASS
jgi:hypothetical protein